MPCTSLAQSKVRLFAWVEFPFLSYFLILCTGRTAYKEAFALLCAVLGRNIADSWLLVTAPHICTTIKADKAQDVLDIAGQETLIENAFGLWCVCVCARSTKLTNMLNE